jgi:antitoxin HicB
MLEYSALFTPDPEAGGFVVTFPDLPEAITEGATEEEAMLYAADAVATSLSVYVDRGMDIPTPRKVSGRNYRRIRIPALSEAKISLYVAMRQAGVRAAGLARRLNCRKSQIDRLLDLSHPSPLDQIEQALRVLGKRLVLNLEDAA